MHDYEFTTTALRETYRPFVRGIAATMAAYLATPTLVHPLELVTAEACANVVRHAYPEGQPGLLRVRLKVNPRVGMELAVTDWGAAARLARSPRPACLACLACLARLARLARLPRPEWLRKPRQDGACTSSPACAMP